MREKLNRLCHLAKALLPPNMHAQRVDVCIMENSANAIKPTHSDFTMGQTASAPVWIYLLYASFNYMLQICVCIVPFRLFGGSFVYIFSSFILVLAGEKPRPLWLCVMARWIRAQTAKHCRHHTREHNHCEAITASISTESVDEGANDTSPIECGLCAGLCMHVCG